MSENSQANQLEMIWPKSKLTEPPVPELAEGYLLRTYREGDEEEFYRIMQLSGFERWPEEQWRRCLKKILPNGWFLIEHEASKAVVATTMATHNPIDRYPFGGELGWVAADSAHSGRALGRATCAAVTDRFIRAGYENIYLKTDDWRLPAIKTYLKLGWVPSFLSDDMEPRWKDVCVKLKWDYESLRV